MKKICLFFLTLFLSNLGHTQTIEGKWINYKNNEPEVLVEIYETAEGEFEGKVIKIYDEEILDLACEKCDENDHRYNQPLLNMIVFTDLQANDDKTKATGGTFLHTKSGKSYDTFIELQDDPDKLDVRGYLGIKAMGKTYTWTREE